MPENDHEQKAHKFLKQQLGNDAPESLTHIATYKGQPLENEGDMSIYKFTASIGNDEPADYHVVAGRTEPNYYPDWNLSPDDLYSLHLGTRFMLVMEIAIAHDVDVTADQFAAVESFIHTVAPSQPITNLSAAAVFRTQDDLLAVFRAKIADEKVYILGLDCPPGIYRETNLPPHVILRRHLGNLIRKEAEQDG